MMSAIETFLAMGGYARFVWPAYGLAALVLGGFFWASWSAWRRTERQWSALEGTRRSRPQ